MELALCLDESGRPSRRTTPSTAMALKIVLEISSLSIEFSRMSDHILRAELMSIIRRNLREFPVVTVLGSRQVGKTTLARDFLVTRKNAHYFDLERDADIARLASPGLALGPLRGLVVIDEVQRMPQLFATLRPIVDRRPLPARFLLLGSASPEIVRGVSESLAGRIAYIDVPGFNLVEIDPENLRQLWWRGGYPRAFLARNDSGARQWLEELLRALTERDLRNLGIDLPAQTVRRFCLMTAHYHGQLWNASEIGRSLGLSDHTVRRYLDILSGAFLVRQLPPWYENLGKRLVKTPKIYWRDSGVVHSLLDVPSLGYLQNHPKVGASWEGFVLEQIVALTHSAEVYHWRTHAGAELDLFLPIGGKRLGFEIKYTDAPAITKSMRVAVHDLRLDHLYIVHAGSASYALATNISAVAASDLPAWLRKVA